MIVEVINTGTELLLGEILNTNFQYLSKHLNDRGFDVLYQTTVGDNEKRMEQVIHTAMSRADMIITTGGLGPTRGDITKDIVMKACNVEGYLDQEVLNKINAFFAKRKTCKASNNDKQAIVPIGATVLNNEVGTAPGLLLEHNNIIEYSLKLDSNPEFTASVLCAYARAAYRMNKEGNVGCKTVLDVPPAYLSPKSADQLRKELL